MQANKTILRFASVEKVSSSYLPFLKDVYCRRQYQQHYTTFSLLRFRTRQIHLSHLFF